MIVRTYIYVAIYFIISSQPCKWTIKYKLVGVRILLDIAVLPHDLKASYFSHHFVGFLCVCACVCCVCVCMCVGVGV